LILYLGIVNAGAIITYAFLADWLASRKQSTASSRAAASLPSRVSPVVTAIDPE
jgi:hypothetical protein